MKKYLFLLFLLSIIFLMACAPEAAEIKPINQTKIQKNITNATPPIAAQTIDVAVSNLSLKSTTFAVNYPIKAIVQLSNSEKQLSDIILVVYDNDDLLKKYKITIKSFETKNIEFEWIPSYAGKHYIKAIVDPENLVKEKYEINNKLELDIRIEE